MSRHTQLLKDYKELRAIAGGCPEDSGEYYDQFAEDLLERPTKAEACSHLENLIDRYGRHGGPLGERLQDDPRAAKILGRYGWADEEGDEE
jgi:hypothetical protein